MGKKFQRPDASTPYPCPVCKGDPQTCPHSFGEMHERQWENYIRSIVRDELSKARTEELRRKSGVG